MPNEDRARVYHRLKRRADLLGTATAGLFLLALLLTGAALQLREAGSMFGMNISGFEEPLTVVAVAVLLASLLSILELPFAYYQGFHIERRYGLSTESVQQWLRDHAKGAILSVAFTALAASVVYATLRWNATWWWAASAAMFALLSVALVQWAPVVLLPLFYKFQPLDRPALVHRLMRLTERAHTAVGGVYEWGLGAHTRKANAALAGIGRTRRILLSDTLLADYSDDEIEVVLAHELAHHVHHDLWRGIALQTALLTVAFLVAHLLLVRLATPLALRGVDDPAGLPLLMLVAGACSLLFAPFAHAVSRAQERRADRYALEQTRQPAAFISAMRRLAQQNLAEEQPSRLVQWLFYSHPPIHERIEGAKRWAAVAERRG